MLTAGRGDGRAAAGAGRDAISCAVALPEAVAVSRATAVTVSMATTSGVSGAVTPSASRSATTAASSTFRQRGTYHKGTDGQAEHESAKHCHRRSASFDSADPSRPKISILDATVREAGATASPTRISASPEGPGRNVLCQP
jgi:hypothetical protein